MNASSRAAALDAADPLARFRDQFVIDDDVIAYLDGNSLGRLPIATSERLARFVAQDWGGRLIRGWAEEWVDLPVTVGDELAGAVLGAAPGQTVIADSTSVDIYKLVHAAVGLRPERRDILIEDTNFPTDRYLVESVAAARGREVKRLTSDPLAGVTPDLVAAALTDQTAAVVLSHVDYRSGALHDVKAITEMAHAAGAVVLWDLCHSAGVVPIELDALGVDLAVGCTYKYLNGGPGSPAWMYVAQRHLGSVAQPISGWWSAADLFAMKDAYEPAADIRRMLSGTPSVAGILAVREGVAMVAAAGLEAIRAKSVALTTMVVEQADDAGLEIASPRDAAARGSHVSVRVPDARGVTAALVQRGVIPDFREPDLVRLGLSPLSTSFAEAELGVAALVDEVKKRT